MVDRVQEELGKAADIATIFSVNLETDRIELDRLGRCMQCPGDVDSAQPASLGFLSWSCAPPSE
jgi:hypothetical protein